MAQHHGKSCAASTPDAGSADRDGASGSVIEFGSEQWWIDLWATGTAAAPGGLGLTWRRVLGHTPRELDALTARHRLGYTNAKSMYYQIRADIHNSSEFLQREDKRRWTAADFGADEVPERPKTQAEIEAEMRFQEMKMMCLMPPKPGGLSIVARMRQEGKGQPIPPMEKKA